jgi:plasmid stabilization system protein ParE
VSRVIVTEGAARGLERCRHFLATKNPQASRRASQAIGRLFDLLQTTPAMGRPFAEAPEWRELMVDFGDSGYVALYRYDPSDDTVLVLAFRHQREAGY